MNGTAWPCGQRATDALVELVGADTVSCRPQGEDRYGRTIATCAVRGQDIGAWLVRHGWALAYRRFSTVYIGDEDEARDAQAGMWRGAFVPPWEWRRGERLQAATAPDSAAGCVIKGNIASSGERIYHVPGGQYYDRTKISPEKGERWFCSEAEAQAAGWRASRQ